MGLETIDPHSLKEHTEIYKIPKFGVNRPNSFFVVQQSKQNAFELSLCCSSHNRRLNILKIKFTNFVTSWMTHNDQVTNTKGNKFGLNTILTLSNYHKQKDAFRVIQEIYLRNCSCFVNREVYKTSHQFLHCIFKKFPRCCWFQRQFFLALPVEPTSLSRHPCGLRTFARKFSNIDFFLRLLPLKVDDLLMSET